MGTEGTGSATPTTLARFVRQKTIVLRTRRRDGTWVDTPVSIAVRGDHAYVRTFDRSGKSKRLRNFPEVRFAPSTFRGSPTGPEVHAQARLLNGDEARSAARLIARKYPILHGVLVPVSHRLMRTKTLHYELSQVQENRSRPDQTNV
ncbi:MAG: PPOX class F420-dependent oxidoreductase [Acidimicrobiales bacterium]